MQNTSREGYSFQEVCDALKINPQALRRLLKDYREVLEYSELEPEASSRYLGADAVETARLVIRFVAEGLDRTQVMERIGLRRAGRGETPQSMNAIELLLGRVEALAKDLAESEKRRAEDRDKMFTTLARTQQELQRLKNEISVATSRRVKNPSLLRRLFSE